MSDASDLLGALRERAKELGCLYQVEKALTVGGAGRSEVLAEVVEAIPPGWQYPEVCGASVRVEDDEARTDNYQETQWVLRAPILVQDDIVGELRVCYTEERLAEDVQPVRRGRPIPPAPGRHRRAPGAQRGARPLLPGRGGGCP